MPQRNLLLLLVVAAVSYACYVRGEQDPYCRYVADGFASIRAESLEPVPGRELFQGAMEGMVDVLHQHGDEHSQFLEEAAANPLRHEIHQQFGGIGVRIGFSGDPPRLTVVSPPDPGTPAAKANLEPGTFILAINDQPTAGMPMRDVLALVRGEPDTAVRLTVQAADEREPRTIELVRAVIQIESIFGDRRGDDGGWRFRLASDPRIAHLRIVSFGEQTADEFQRIVDRLLAEGTRAMVLDVRDNPGGALDAAVAVCQMLLPAGKTIVKTHTRGQPGDRTYETSTDGAYCDLPLAVIVNQNTASAGEILAACLQDHGRAAVAGERTYGKGTVQQLLPLESGKSLLKLTWASFRRPSGATIHRTPDAGFDAPWGVSPNAGLAWQLTPPAYADYARYREERDGLRPPAAAEESESDGQASFVDHPLQLAVEHLQKKLGNGP
jgi:carboxyl-terminal processing protease